MLLVLLLLLLLLLSQCLMDGGEDEAHEPTGEVELSGDWLVKDDADEVEDGESSLTMQPLFRSVLTDLFPLTMLWRRRRLLSLLMILPFWLLLLLLLWWKCSVEMARFFDMDMGLNASDGDWRLLLDLLVVLLDAVSMDEVEDELELLDGGDGGI